MVREMIHHEGLGVTMRGILPRMMFLGTVPPPLSVLLPLLPLLPLLLVLLVLVALLRVVVLLLPSCPGFAADCYCSVW